jgi:protein kinase-like protein
MVVSPAPWFGASDPFAPYEYVRPIGSRPNQLHLVRRAAPREKPKLIVAERFIGAAAASVGQAAAFVSEARRISTLASPNVARVRELAVRGDDLVVFWEFIDGEKLADVWLSSGLSLELSLRLILDVLAGVGAIHSVRDAKQQPMHLAHGELSGATVVVGIDGIARVLHAIARRLPGAQTEQASLGYLAPEVHAGAPFDARADVFGAGVLLWESLSGTRLFPESDSVAILARLQSVGLVPAQVPSGAPWAKGLVGVAAKALAISPEDRWPSPAEMAAEIRKVAGLRLAPAVAASSFAQAAMGERVRARRLRLESAAASTPSVTDVDKPPQAVSWSVPSSAGPGARRWSDADASSAGAPIVAHVPVAPPVLEAAEPPTEPKGETLLESLPPSALNSVIPGPPEAPVDVPPPPLPARAFPQRVTGLTNVGEASSESDLAASLDVPISLPPPSVPVDELPALDLVEPSEVGRRVDRRRTAAVLGGVSALGLVVFALAGWRVAHRSAAPLSLGTYANSVPAAIAETAVTAQAAAPTQQAATAQPTQPGTPSASTPGAPSVPRAARPPAPRSAPAPRPSSAAVPHKQSTPPAGAHAKATSRTRFDPNSL